MINLIKEAKNLLNWLLLRFNLNIFNHLVYNKYQTRETLLDDIIFEGLAENFREYAVNGKHAPWAKVLSLKECKRTFAKIKKSLNSRSRKVYYSVFFKDKEYPLWSGYSIGYQIVKSFLKNNPIMNWEEIMRLKSEEILEKSNFR